ncbi:MAG: transposase [Armatimonadota bacterium]
MSESDHQSPDFIREFRKTRRHLPHWQAPGETHYVTFALLDRRACDLTSPGLAHIIIDALQFRHEQRYTLLDWVIMPDHVHFIVYPLMTDEGFFSLSKITGSMKGWTAHEINREMDRRVALWQDESFDRVIRSNGEYRKHAFYIWMNPVKAGLVESPRDWQWWGNGRFCRRMQRGDE